MKYVSIFYEKGKEQQIVSTHIIQHIYCTVNMYSENCS